MFRFVILIISLWFSVPAMAQPSNGEDPLAGVEGVPAVIVVEFLPEGRRCKSKGIEYMCYTLEEYKSLLQIDVNLQASLQTLELEKQKSVKLLNINTQLRLGMDSAEAEIESLHDSRNRLFEKWQNTNQKWLEEKHKPNLGSVLSWGLVLGEGAVIFGLILAMVLGG